MNNPLRKVAGQGLRMSGSIKQKKGTELSSHALFVMHAEGILIEMRKRGEFWMMMMMMMIWMMTLMMMNDNINNGCWVFPFPC